MSDNKILKQDYVEANLIKQNYNFDNFVQYCNEKHPDRKVDVYQWHYNQLKQIVQEYKQEYEPDEDAEMSFTQSYLDNKRDLLKDEQQIEGDSLIQNQNKDMRIERSQSTFQNKSSNQGKDFSIKQLAQGESMSKQVYECQRLPLYKIQEYLKDHPDEKVTVTIEKAEIVKGGIFDASFAAFHIKTMPFDWNVQRRYTEFMWLKHYLEKTFPGTFIPPIPAKKQIRSLEDSYIHKRRKMLQYFLQYLVQNETLLFCGIVCDFLSIQDSSLFKQKQREAEGHNRPQKIQHFTTKTGEISIILDKEVNDYAKHYTKYVESTVPTYHKIKTLSKSLFLQQDGFCNSVSKMANYFATLSEQSATFSKQINGGNYQEKIYTILNNFCSNWAEFCTQQMIIVKEHFHEFFRYQTKLNRQLKKFQKSRNILSDFYDKAVTKLADKKEKLFASKETTKWELPNNTMSTNKELLFNKGQAFELMLPTETQQVADVGLVSGAINKLFYTESQDIQRIKLLHYQNSFNEFTKRMADSITDYHLQLADTMSYLQFREGGGDLQLRKFDLYDDQDQEQQIQGQNQQQFQQPQQYQQFQQPQQQAYQQSYQNDNQMNSSNYSNNSYKSQQNQNLSESNVSYERKPRHHNQSITHTFSEEIRERSESRETKSKNKSSRISDLEQQEKLMYQSEIIQSSNQKEDVFNVRRSDVIGVQQNSNKEKQFQNLFGSGGKK